MVSPYNLLKNKITLVLVFTSVLSFAQSIDTLSIRPIEIISSKVNVEKAYKNQLIDSVTMNSIVNASLSEVLNAVTPIFIKSYGQGAIASPSFRGTGASHTQVFWNGMAVNSPVIGMTDLSIVPVNQMDEVEVHYGLSSLEDGTGGLGGSIQLNNDVNWNDSLSLELNGMYGSFNTYSGGLKLVHGNHKIQHQAGISYHQSSNDFEYMNISKSESPVEKQSNAEIKQIGVFQNVFYKWDNKNEISFKYNFFNSDRNLPKLITSNFNDENLKDQTFRSLIQWDNSSTNRLISTQIGFWQEWLQYKKPSAAMSSGYTSYSLVSNVRYTQFWKEWKMKWHYNFNNSWVNSDNYNDVTSLLRNSLMVNVGRTLFEKLYINMLLREELVGENWSPLLPSVGLGYSINSYITAKANVARSYRYPSFNDLFWSDAGAVGNLELLPEQGWAKELGVVYNTHGLKNKLNLNIEATAFHSNITNWIIWLPDPDQGSFWTPQNKKEVENLGIESLVGINGNIRKLKFNLNTVYSYVSSKNVGESSDLDNSIDKQLIYVPMHQFKFNSSITYLEYYLVLQHLYTGKTYVTTDNDWYLPSYDVNNLTVGKQIQWNGIKLTVAFRINNAFNQQYQVIAWRPMPGRNYQASIKVRL